MRSHPLTSSFVVRICVYHTTVLWNFHALIGGLCVSENGHWARFCVLNRQCKNHIVRSRHFLSSLIKTWSSYTSPLDCRLRKVIDSMCRSFSYVFLLLRDIKMSTSYFYCSLLTFCRFSTLLPFAMNRNVNIPNAATTNTSKNTATGNTTTTCLSLFFSHSTLLPSTMAAPANSNVLIKVAVSK